MVNAYLFYGKQELLAEARRLKLRLIRHVRTQQQRGESLGLAVLIAAILLHIGLALEVMA